MAGRLHHDPDGSGPKPGSNFLRPSGTCSPSRLTSQAMRGGSGIGRGLSSPRPQGPRSGKTRKHKATAKATVPPNFSRKAGTIAGVRPPRCPTRAGGAGRTKLKEARDGQVGRKPTGAGVHRSGKPTRLGRRRGAAQSRRAARRPLPWWDSSRPRRVGCPVQAVHRSVPRRAAGTGVGGNRRPSARPRGRRPRDPHRPATSADRGDGASNRPVH